MRTFLARFSGVLLAGIMGLVLTAMAAAGAPAPKTGSATAAVRPGMVEGDDNTPRATTDRVPPSLDRSSSGLRIRTLPDGSRQVNLEGRFRAYSVASIGPDGTLRMTCFEGREAAQRWVAAQARLTSRPTPFFRCPRSVFGPEED